MRIPAEKRPFFLLLMPLALLLCVLTLTSCEAKEPLTDTRFLLDTICTVTVYRQADKKAAADALALCETYDTLFSRTKEGSDIWRINNGGGEAQTVDMATAELINAGLAYGAFSGGGFDISIGRLSALWDFGNSNTVPNTAALAAALETVDYTQVHVDGNTVRLANAEAWLDLGGIAKGYIGGQMAALLQERGVNSAIIDLGGNIITVGTKPDGKPWSIGIRLPFSGYRGLAGVLTINGEARATSIITSGIYERYFMENETYYHHVLDTATGWPAESDLASATMITENSTQGDALSTIFLLAGSAKAPELMKQYPDLQGVVLVLKSGEVLSYGDIDFTAAD